MSEINFTIISSKLEKSKICESILRSLPQWFGIESAIVNYVNDVEKMDTWIASINDAPIGFLPSTSIINTQLKFMSWEF